MSVPRTRCILAYSGGLDTSVAVHWLTQERGFEVVTLSVDLGESRDPAQLQQRALLAGASAAHVIDARDLFVRHFVWPALLAGARYQGVYPLATALGRPLIARLLVELAREEGAGAVAHGCTGKGNDQVRFDVAVAALAPELTVVAPVRDWDMGRPEEIAYAAAHGIEVPVTRESPYSIDANLWGRSVETGVLEDPWAEPPADAYEWTADPRSAPAGGQVVTVAFEAGLPTALDGEPLEPVALVERANRLAGTHGVGRIDHVEDRLVGIKSREVYEAPGAVLLDTAHRALEGLTLSRDVLRVKAQLAEEWARLVYDGLWYSHLRQCLTTFAAATQGHVTGEVRLRLCQGTAQVVGRRSPCALYRPELATYERAGDRFHHRAAEGFIALFGLPLRTQAAVQGQLTAPDDQTLLPPRAQRRIAGPAGG
ncbi:MAG TPA: argininosuccinate synthase [Candidatus Micrarchaeia archaeon]|nr:argininosuccinate synthase [Candidatus Micrarchaeia archaeon]